MKLGTIYIVYDPETKEQSKEWKHSGSNVQRSSRQTSWDKDGVLLVDYLEKGANIMAKYYIALLDKL
jgi:hypothetical protein